jgi:TRAP-type uncharacterized transport system substrate-binding protein
MIIIKYIKKSSQSKVLILNKKKTILLILILIFLLLLLYCMWKSKKTNNITEHYLTYFLPFNEGNEEKINLYNFYSDNLNNSLYFKKKMDYNKLNIGIAVNTMFSEYLLKIFLGNTNLLIGHTINYNKVVHSIDDLLDNKINLLICDDISIFYYKNILNKNSDNLRIVTYLNKEYLYIFVKKDSNIFSLTTFPPGCTIGLLGDPDVLQYYIYKLLKDLGYQKNVDYNIKIYSTIEELFDNLKLSNVDIIMILDIFPSNNINNALDKSIADNILLLPFDVNNEKVFFQKNSFLKVDYVDLNLLPKNYLPKKFGKYHYNKNLPTIKMCYFKKIMLTNSNIENKYTYNIIEYYDKNIDYLNELLTNKGYDLDKSYFDERSIIPYHQGVIEYFIEKGYSSYIDHPNCKYLVGVMKCTEKTLKENNLYYSV